MRAARADCGQLRRFSLVEIAMTMKRCSGCTRRALLHGIGVAAASLVILESCAQQGSGLPPATTSSCSGGTCIDLSDSANADLANPGGAMLVDIASDTVIVIRTSATEVIALSAICTHAGCSMDFDAARERLTCPCHGSEFDETGAVTKGPARVPLKVYTATLANEMITVS
jgi:cytochrome b6-f complex iron-sulfur subunit